MKKTIMRHYQKLSLVTQLLIPLVIAILFGIGLTINIVQKVQAIEEKTILLNNTFIPFLEKSTSNIALLKKISASFSFAALGEDEELLSDIKDVEIVQNNLKEIIGTKHINLEESEKYFESFTYYYNIGSRYAYESIQGFSSSKEENELSSEVSENYKKVEICFAKLNGEMKTRILETSSLIEEMLANVIYFTIVYILFFTIILLYISYLIYKDLIKRLEKLNGCLHELGVKKELLTGGDTIGNLSENITKTVEAYSIIDEQREQLVQVNEKVQSSIDYAALMQESILPLESAFDKYTKQSMICWQPKDTVGGDIYFIDELHNQKELVIMVIDGVGHGVPGAFLTILVKAIQTQIIAKINQGEMEASPGKVLEYFNVRIKEMLKQESYSDSNFGLDGGVMVYNRETTSCKYAGAKLPLYIVDKGKVEVIRGDRSSVGFVRIDMNQTYTDYEIKINKDAKYYMITDGMIDQVGKNNTQYSKKRFKELILKNHDKFFLEQKGAMFNDFNEFKLDSEQSDDITVLGMQFL